MATPKKYSQDRTVLILLSLIVFMGLAGSIVAAVRLLNTHATSYIVQYRSNLGLDAFKSGNIQSLAAFVAFMLLIVVGAIILSRKTYPLRRHLSLGVLGFSIVLLAFAVVVSNALLGLR